jgi:hypothetical protein
MIGKWKVTSGQINKCFARDVVSWFKHGTKLNWGKYAIYYDKYNVEFIKRDQNGEFDSASKKWCFYAVKWAPRPSSYICVRLMFEAIHGQTLQNNNCQILTKLEIDKNMKILGKWDVKEIQVC